MITKFYSIPVLILCLTCAFGGLLADTVTNAKTKEVIENVKTSENEQGIIVEYEDGTKRGFKKDAVSVTKKDVQWAKEENAAGNKKKDWLEIGLMSGMALLFLLLP
ncbi:hypothetical protein CH379_003085 [Leptospira ellisii]|uniref:Uncharacterized protein n=1 Tax=Leptospira ellisii TaxID=2023197 RepID=A0A2N0BMM9_9LEPT|nr:hypothetical protein [Leptospira ellisii]MDV6234611.1 hypothetical protein [Leptospira ellisii]PJZ92408.1 hypothetical protein CH379_13350 [Leptospira ellisii]PKA05249.1 hypothetical protein CH375_06190 [Leptospira ellisii]